MLRMLLLLTDAGGSVVFTDSSKINHVHFAEAVTALPNAVCREL
jgi:hypothetical protein